MLGFLLVEVNEGAWLPSSEGDKGASASKFW